MRRIKEVLETHDWSASGDEAQHLDADLNAELDFDVDDFDADLRGSGHTSGFGHEVHELEREMLGLRMAIERGGDDDGQDEGDGEDEVKVESMEALMMRVKAIRGMFSGWRIHVRMSVDSDRRYKLRVTGERAEKVRSEGCTGSHARDMS